MNSDYESNDLDSMSKGDLFAERIAIETDLLPINIVSDRDLTAHRPHENSRTNALGDCLTT